MKHWRVLHISVPPADVTVNTGGFSSGTFSSGTFSSGTFSISLILLQTAVTCHHNKAALFSKHFRIFSTTTSKDETHELFLLKSSAELLHEPPTFLMKTEVSVSSLTPLSLVNR